MPTNTTAGMDDIPCFVALILRLLFKYKIVLKHILLVFIRASRPFNFYS